MPTFFEVTISEHRFTHLKNQQIIKILRLEIENHLYIYKNKKTLASKH